MPQILLEIDEPMARALEKAAPAKSRQRARFIRLAIQKALLELAEPATREAYARSPEPKVSIDPRTWGEWKPPRRRRAHR